MSRGALLLVAAILAGCARAPDAPPAPSLEPERAHDHAALDGHALAWGLVRVGGADADALLGDAPGRLSDLQFHEGLAAVAVNGGTGGFLLLDAASLGVISRYESGSEDNWYVKFTPDGRFVLLTANGKLPPAPGAALDALAQPALPHAARGLQVIDITTPAAPRLAGAYASPIRLINAAPWEHDGATYVAASVVLDRAVGPAPATGAAANEVHILRIEDDGRPTLVARWPVPGSSASAFAHDLSVEVHPVTGDVLLYAGCWDAGACLVDVSDPAAPRALAVWRPEGEKPQVHTVKPHPGLIAGRHYTLASPETFAGEASGRYHLLDTTDPARPSLVATWELPGALVNDEPLLWSPHESSLGAGRAWTSNFHAGVVALELPALTPVAAWAAPPALGPEQRARWAVDVETTVWHEGRAHALDMGRGIDVLAPAS